MVAFAADKASSGYPASEYLDDLTDLLTVGIRKGKVCKEDEFPLSIYMAMGLMANSPMMQANYQKAFHRTGGLQDDFSLDDAMAPVLSDIPPTSLADLDNDCYNAMERLRSILEKAARSESDPYKKGMLDYLLKLSDSALGKK